jgi:hypothetical protein
MEKYHSISSGLLSLHEEAAPGSAKELKQIITGMTIFIHLFPNIQNQLRICCNYIA